MTQRGLFKEDASLAARQPKTDRLFLARLVRTAGEDNKIKDEDLAEQHAILVRWADFERAGRLAELTETQLQGDFLRDVFGDALGYTRAAENLPAWNLEQHLSQQGHTPDAVLGRFAQDEPKQPKVVIELKGPGIHLDRDRSNGRTAVDQCWDYLVDIPTARWGIVSNIVSIRLYERNSTKRVYEHFSLQSLRDINVFRQFHALFNRKGLIEPTAGIPPTVERLFEETRTTQREVGDKLYQDYSHNRTNLIRYLHFELGHPVDLSIEMAQRLFDRVMFIAFCEDRNLLPKKTIPKAYSVAGFHDVTNPRWQNFKRLFKFINVGNEPHEIPKYNGGLFADHPVDQLELPDEPWTNFFHTISTYSFADEVNLDVLGHLFERSITELEKAKLSGLFGDAEKAERFATMPQSVKRKQLGIYYTPPELTSLIVEYTVSELIDERFATLATKFGISKKDAARRIMPDDEAFWRGCLDILRNLTIVDPACGSGAFLFQAYNVLEHRYFEVIGHLHQFDRSPGSVPISGSGEMGTAPFTHRLDDSQSSDRSPPLGSTPLHSVCSPPLGGEGLGEGGNHARVSSAELAAQVPFFILNDNLYGVDLSSEAVEITQLALWIRSATPGQTLATLSRNIVHGNSLVHDPDKHPHGFNWQTRFSEVFSPRPLAGGSSPVRSPPLDGSNTKLDRSPPLGGEGLGEGGLGFDCVIGNPPWERIKLQEREFFSLPAPEIATATNAATRRKLVTKLESDDPALYTRYQQALAAADSLLTYCRAGAYPLTGKGDINTYAVFAELAYNIVAPHGRVGLLTPSGIASDKTTMDFFAAIAETNRLIRLYDFENKKVFFPEVHGAFKFCILNFGGEDSKRKAADFAFFIHDLDELEDKDRQITLSGDDIKLLNPNTRTCPIFRTRRDAEITKEIYRRVPILIDHNRTGPTANPWGIRFYTMFHQTNDAELFHEPDTLKQDGYKIKGNRWVKGKQTYLPVYEAKMVQAYDHRAASVVTDTANWVRQGQTAGSMLVQWQSPEYSVLPRFWASSEVVETQLKQPVASLLAYKDVTSPTNQRTMISAMIPVVGVVNSAPLIFTDQPARRTICLLGNLNSFAYDFFVRQKISNLHLNFFIVEQAPTFPPDTYTKPCPWSRKNTKLETWISERVLKLTCTAEDMLPLADACDFTAGSFKTEYGGRLNKWDEAERAQLMAELDAAYFHLYGISRDDAEYILSTFKGIHESTPLIPGSRTKAEHILALYDEYAAQM